MVFAEASAALSSIKAAIDIISGINSLKINTEVNSAIIEIQRLLLEAQSATLNDKQTIGELGDRLRDLQRLVDAANQWEETRSKYQLVRSPIGAYTYDLKPEFSDIEPFHRLCPNCFDNGGKSILHTIKRVRGGEVVECLRCTAKIQLSEFQAIPAKAPTRKLWLD